MRSQPIEAERLSVENRFVLDLVQAAIGALSANVRRVGLTMVSSDRVRLQFLVERDDPVDRDEIDDIAFEFDALQDHRVRVDVEILVDSRPIPEVPFHPDRLTYGRREQPNDG